MFREVVLSDVCLDIQYGYTAKSSQVASGPRYLRITDIQDGDVDWPAVPRCEIDQAGLERFSLQQGDIVFARSGATVGKSFMITGDHPQSVFASYLIRVRPNQKQLDSKFAYAFFQSADYWQQINDGASGTGQPNFNGTKLAALRLPLPPLAEQRRIVARIEALFTRTRRARAELERAAGLVSAYRKTTVRQAFNGELLGREASPSDLPGELCWDLPAGWRWVRFSEAAEIASNLVNPKDIQELPHIAPDNIEAGSAKLLPYRTIREDEVISPKHRFLPGQIIYSKIRPYLRKAILVDFEGACSADMYPLNVNKGVDSHYLLFWLTSEEFSAFTSQYEGRTVLPKINQNGLNRTQIPLPPLDVQRHLAQKLQECARSTEEIHRQQSRALALLDRLEHAILTRAFRGDLVPQDQSDAPVSLAGFDQADAGRGRRGARRHREHVA